MFKISYNHVLAWQYANDMVDKVDAEIAKVLQPGFSKAVTLGRSPNTFQVNVMVNPRGYTHWFLNEFRKHKDLRLLLSGSTDYLRSVCDMVRMDSPENFIKLTKRKYDRCYAGQSTIDDFHTIMTHVFVECGYEIKGFVDQESIINGIGLKVCPYCGQTYIGTVKYQRGSGKLHLAKAQIDHFLPKGKYPFLALSYANFIPSCPSCNLSHKHIEDVMDDQGRMKIMSPYDFDATKFMFEFGLKNGGYMNDDNIEVKTIFDESTIQNRLLKEGYKSIMGIDKLYEYHNDVVMDILIKKAIGLTSQQLYYNKGVGIDDAFHKRYITAIYGYEPDPGQDKKRVMSKFIRDIVKQVDEMVKKANG